MEFVLSARQYKSTKPHFEGAQKQDFPYTRVLYDLFRFDILGRLPENAEEKLFVYNKNILLVLHFKNKHEQMNISYEYVFHYINDEIICDYSKD